MPKGPRQYTVHENAFIAAAANCTNWDWKTISARMHEEMADIIDENPELALKDGLVDNPVRTGNTVRDHWNRTLKAGENMETEKRDPVVEADMTAELLRKYKDDEEMKKEGDKKFEAWKEQCRVISRAYC